MSARSHLGLSRSHELREPSFAQLGVFNAIMISGSVSRAAKLLGMTQSAASKMLRQLEDVLDGEPAPTIEDVLGRLQPPVGSFT